MHRYPTPQPSTLSWNRERSNEPQETTEDELHSEQDRDDHQRLLRHGYRHQAGKQRNDPKSQQPSPGLGNPVQRPLEVPADQLRHRVKAPLNRPSGTVARLRSTRSLSCWMRPRPPTYERPQLSPGGY